MIAQFRTWCCAAQQRLKLLTSKSLVQVSTRSRNMSQQQKTAGISAKVHAEGSELPPLQGGVMRLYSMRFCPFAHRARLVLASKKIPYETVNIHLTSKPAWFLKKNLNGEVPVVEKDGAIVYDSLTVAEYLDSVYNYEDHPLVSSDPLRKAHDAMIISFNGSKVVPNYYKIINAKGEDEDCIKAFMSGLTKLEEFLAQRGTKYFGGDTPTYVDFMIWPWQERLPVLKQYPKVDLSMKDLPRLKEWQTLMKEQEAVKTCAQTDDMHTKFIALWKGGDANPYDVGLNE